MVWGWPRRGKKKKKPKSKKDWGCGLSGRMIALQAQGPEFRLQYNKKQANKQNPWKFFTLQNVHDLDIQHDHVNNSSLENASNMKHDCHGQQSQKQVLNPYMLPFKMVSP
jgi:hypothetical protein